MSDQPGGEVPSGTARAWDSVSWLREPVAWTLLALTAILLLVSACQLFNLAGATIPVPSPAAVSGPVPIVPVGSTPVPATAFALRASAVAPQFIDIVVQALPVLAVVLVAFCGGLTERARQVVTTAVVVLAVAFVLGLISLAGAAGAHLRPDTWFILEATRLAFTATALIFTGAVVWSQPFRPLASQLHKLGEGREGLEDEPDF